MNLSPTRLVLGLLFAPLPVAGLLALTQMDIGQLSRTFMVWFVLIGIAYLAGACLLRRSIGRTGCLVAGTAAGATWSYGQILLYAISPAFLVGLLGFPVTTHSPGEVLAHFLASPAAWTSPPIGGVAGCCSGWLLWRLGVRPAPEPQEKDLTEVFE